MLEMFKELVQYRNLLFMLTWRDIKVKYKQSVMGFFWAIFMPMLIVLAGILVKKAFSIFSGKPMQFAEIVSVSVKALPWAFFVGSIRFAVLSLTSNSNLVTKIYFPREVFPLAAVLAHLFDFALGAVFLALVLTFVRIGLSIYSLWILVLLILLILITSSFALILSCANLFFRDVKYIVEALLTFAIFFTPVFYEAKMFGRWAGLLLLNPVGAVLENLNTVLILQQPPSLIWLGYAGLWAVWGFLGAWFIFHKLEPVFAENI